MHHARRAASNRRSPCGLHAHQFGGTVDEPAEDAGRVGATAHAGHHHVGVAAEQFAALAPRLIADDPVELAHHPGIRMRAHHRAEAVVGPLHGGHPVAQRLVDGVLEGAAAGGDGVHLGTQQAHAEHVQLLPGHIHLAHVHRAVHPQQRRRGRCGHAVLAGAGLGHEAGLAHALGQERLSQHVVDLVGAGVVEILPLEQQAQAQLRRQARAIAQRRGTPGVVRQQVVEPLAERFVGPGGAEGPIEFLAGGHQGLGDVAAPEVAEAPFRRRFCHAHANTPVPVPAPAVRTRTASRRACPRVAPLPAVRRRLDGPRR